MVLARIDVYPGRTRNPEGSIVEILGQPDDPEVEILTIAHKHDLPYRFPEEVLAAVGGSSRPGGSGGPGRTRGSAAPAPGYHRRRDGQGFRRCGRCASREKDGRIRLWVAIADVGHYVPEGSAIDEEALERGTSVYFPGRAIPMLPERLSNGICSLNPAVDRLAMTAEMVFDRQGERLESRFYPAVIRSQARLTYTRGAGPARLAMPPVGDIQRRDFCRSCR